MPDFSEQIEQAVNDPASHTSDGQTTASRPIGDLIKADQYAAQKAAGKRKLRGIAVTTLIAPGALDDSGRGPLGGFDRPGGC